MNAPEEDDDIRLTEFLTFCSYIFFLCMNVNLCLYLLVNPLISLIWPAGASISLSTISNIAFTANRLWLTLGLVGWLGREPVLAFQVVKDVRDRDAALGLVLYLLGPWHLVTHRNIIIDIIGTTAKKN